MTRARGNEPQQADTGQRFDALLRAMLGAPASQTHAQDIQTSDTEHDEDCGDTQTPTDTSEDVS
jgi:hypothetical protein